ncbi:MAG: NADH-quinone oxidoreductase subunit M [Alphaproteobacteria bacterium]|nr:NADH-quinone oxidoreductase subunit M [Alphaproteobacteria bacterium]
MEGFPLLSLITFLPLIGAIALLFVRPSASRQLALFVSTLVFGLSVYLLLGFDKGDADFQFVENFKWLPSLNISYHLGVDGISIFFVVLSALLVPLCILASWNSIYMQVKEYMIAFLALETFMIGSFVALDAMLFYVFFEGVLIPMFLIIGIWGGKRRVYSAFKFFLYTLLGSVLMLIALLYMYGKAGTTDIPSLIATPFPREVQIWLWLAFFASFAVKMPMWPVHTWLPDAHVEAPTAGSVILAGILLKMGGYGFLRFSLPMFPEASEYFAPLVFALSIIAIIYTSLVALVQTDMKKLIAYSSVAHMGFVTMGIFTFNIEGISGALFQMISHGFISGALFLCVGVVYDRLHTRDLDRYGGLAKNMPVYATLFMIFMLGSVGLPGTSGFVGEFLSLLGAFKANTWVAFLAAIGVVLGAAYMLRLYRIVVFGEQKHADAAAMKDANKLEIFIFLPLLILVFWLGVSPAYVMERVEPTLQKLTTQVTAGQNLIPQRPSLAGVEGDIKER